MGRVEGVRANGLQCDYWRRGYKNNRQITGLLLGNVWQGWRRDRGSRGKPSVKWRVLGGHSINRCVSHHRDGLSTPTQGGSCCRVRGREVLGPLFSSYLWEKKLCLNKFLICEVLLSQS